MTLAAKLAVEPPVWLSCAVLDVNLRAGTVLPATALSRALHKSCAVQTPTGGEMSHARGSVHPAKMNVTNMQKMAVSQLSALQSKFRRDPRCH